MRTDHEKRMVWCGLVLFFFYGARGFAQSPWAAEAEDPRWWRLRVDEVNTLLEIESQQEKRTITGTTAERDYLFVEPSLELKLRGSVYHPNLLEFDLQPQLGLSWQSATLDPPGSTKDTTRLLQRYHASVNLLKEKPVATSLSADKELTYRDFDFFTRARVNSDRYGASTGYGDGPVPFHVSASHLEEEVTGGLVRSSRVNENTLSFDAHNERGQVGRSDVTYVLDQFRRRDEGVPDTKGVDHSANLFDAETLGAGDWVKLNSALLYHRLDDSTLGTRGLTLQENLNLDHANNLSSNYHYAFDARTSGTVDSDSHQGSAAVRHQLYESLTSVLEVRGSSLNSRSPGSTFDTRRYGAGWSETYTKRLSTWGRLTLGNSLQVDHERRETTGQFIMVVDESHPLTTGGPITYLNQPNVDTATVFVTDSTGTIVYALGLDYLLISHGVLTEIQRPPGSAIPDGGTVLVDYTAIAQPSGSFVTLDNHSTFRLDFFDGVLGLFARAGYIRNYGGKGIILQDVTDVAGGADTTWRWLHAGAEYEEFDSNLTPFRTVSVFENFEFHPSEQSLLSFDVSQHLTTFPDTDQKQSSYDFIGRHRIRLTSFLAATTEGGVRFVRGRGLDQDLATARAMLDFAYGQLTVNLVYEFQNETFLGELRERHYFYLRAKRTF